MNLREMMDVYRGYRIPHFKIIELKNRCFALSGILIALSILGFVWQGLDYSIDFEGGALISYPAGTTLEAADVQGTLAEFGIDDAEVQIVNGDEPQIAIRTESLTMVEDRTGLLEALASQAGVTFDDISVEDVGTTWGAEISSKALRGLILVLLAISAYIWQRFEWEMAAGAMIALIHDVIITVGVYALTGRQVTPETVIAVLTILGFSLYDTVVIYDKVKENTESPAMVEHYGYVGVVDRSLNQVLMGSVNTSLVVLLPILSLLLFGGDTLKDFAKSTLLHLLGGLDTLSEGEVTLRDAQLSQLTEYQATLARRHNVGFVFQFFNLLPTLTAQENILLPVIIDGKNPNHYEERLKQILELVGLYERRKHKPDHLRRRTTTRRHR